MKINGTGAVSHSNMGVVSRSALGASVESAHDNGRRAHGHPDSFRSDFRSLVRAVSKGDMTSAQSALAAIKTDVASSSATYSPTTTTTSTASSISADLKSLFDAVGSGDATSAQTALVKFVSDRQDAWRAQSDAASTATGSSPSLQGHQGRRFYDLEAVIASLFTDSTSAPSSTDSASTEATDSTSTDSAPVDTTSVDATPADTTASPSVADTTTTPAA